MTKRIVTMVVTGAVLASSLTVGTAGAAVQPVSGPVIEHMRPTLPWLPSRPAARAHPQRNHDRAATRLLLQPDTLSPPTCPGAAAVLPDNVTYYGGPVLHSPTVHLIFWLPAGFAFEPQGSDQRYENLIVQYFQDLSGSGFNNILMQYYDGTDCIHNSVTLGDWVVDSTNAYPQGRGTQANPLLDSDIQAEVNYWMQARGWAAGPDTMIFVYTGYGVESCFDLAQAQGCSFPTTGGKTYAGYHHYFAANVWPVSYASMPDSATHMDIFRGVPTSPNNDIIADNEISITSHEQFEMESDPLENGWSDIARNEIGDKCVYNYVSVNPDGSNVVMNGHPYILQAEWSNYQHGCALHLP